MCPPYEQGPEKGGSCAPVNRRRVCAVLQAQGAAVSRRAGGVEAGRAAPAEPWALRMAASVVAWPARSGGPRWGLPPWGLGMRGGDGEARRGEAEMWWRERHVRGCGGGMCAIGACVRAPMWADERAPRCASRWCRASGGRWR